MAEEPAEDARARAIRGFEALHMDLFGEAIAWFNGALALEPRDPVLLEARGRARLRLLQSLRASDPRSPAPADARRELDLALADLALALTLDADRYPAWASVRAAQRWLLDLEGERDAAAVRARGRDLCRACLRPRPQRAESLLERAKVWLFDLGDAASARVEFEIFLGLRPEFEPWGDEETRLLELHRTQAWPAPPGAPGATGGA